MHCGDFDDLRARFEAAGKRGGWGAFGPGGEFFGPGFGFWGGGGRGGPGGRRRVFEQGDLKYVILRLLDERPRHGYEIIKELEARSGGTYSPSPGTVYPTLTLLEDLGYARATPEEGGKKIYEITDAGRAHLKENRGQVDDIFERIAQFGASFFGDAMMEVNRAMGDLARAVYANAPRHAGDPERLRRVREVLERAARDLQEIAAEPKK
jgi:DNA-binding PadR family transcriptional regulator